MIIEQAPDRRWKKIRKEFVAEFLQDKEKKIGLQSYHSRLKDTEHLVEKLVRKRLENYAKYRKMDATNYMRYVTDLIGIRGLLLYTGGLGKLP